jgi:hypothetical protein
MTWSLRIVSAISVLIVISLVCFSRQVKVRADGYDCVLADDKGDTWVSLWQEDVHGNKGKQILNVSLFHKGFQFGIEHSMNGPNQGMRYDYKNAPNDPMHGNVGFTCRNGERIVLQ